MFDWLMVAATGVAILVYISLGLRAIFVLDRAARSWLGRSPLHFRGGRHS